MHKALVHALMRRDQEAGSAEGVDRSSGGGRSKASPNPSPPRQLDASRGNRPGSILQHRSHSAAVCSPGCDQRVDAPWLDLGVIVEEQHVAGSLRLGSGDPAVDRPCKTLAAGGADDGDAAGLTNHKLWRRVIDHHHRVISHRSDGRRQQIPSPMAGDDHRQVHRLLRRLHGQGEHQATPIRTTRYRIAGIPAHWLAVIWFSVFVFIRVRPNPQLLDRARDPHGPRARRIEVHHANHRGTRTRQILLVAIEDVDANRRAAPFFERDLA